MMEKMFLIQLLLTIVTIKTALAIPTGKTNGPVTGGMHDIEFYNRMLSDEINSHLDGDVYVDDILPAENTKDGRDPDIQHAPLKKWEQKRWPNGVVPYVIVSKEYTSEEKRLIRAGLRDIEAAAPCLRFDEYAEGDSRVPNTHIQVYKGLGCWSLIGRTSSGKAQRLALDYYCITEDKGVIIHEFLHALGFYHEQARPDRDLYLRIFWDRLSDGAEAQFRKTDRTDDLGVAYDPISIMHYPNTAYAKEYGTITMEWKANPKQVLGGNKLSSKDILQLNRLYCDDDRVVTTTKRPTTIKITTTTLKPKTKTTTATRKPTTTTTTTTRKPTTTTTTTTTTRKPTTTTTKTTRKPTTTTQKPTITTQKPKTTSTTQKPTRTTTTVQPEKKICGDYAGLSCLRAQPGRCSSYMQKRCPRSCGVCTGPESEICLNLKNKWNSQYCESLAFQGRCQTSSYGMRYQMKTQCTKTCCQRNELYTYKGQRG